MTSIDDAALQRLCDVARMAGREIMRLYGTTAAWRQKADASRNSAAVGERPSPLRYNSPDLRVPGFVLGSDATAATPVASLRDT